MIARHWTFRAAVGLVAITATIVVAEDTSVKGVLRVALLALAAGAGSWFMCAAMVFLLSLELAMHRQRVYARAQPGLGQWHAAGKKITVEAELDAGESVTVTKGGPELPATDRVGVGREQPESSSQSS